MMRLEPTHKLLAGVNAASWASVPVVILLFVLVLRTFPPAIVHAPPIGVASRPPVTGLPPLASQQKPSEAVRTPGDLRQQPAVTGKKPTPGRVLYSVRWSGSENRRRVFGSIPEYPAGVTGEAMARLELVVSGAGTVQSARVLQSGNPRCDEAALREVRLWKFEALPRQAKRTDQRCVVTISFIRK